jgi:hypothetical protein
MRKHGGLSGAFSLRTNYRSGGTFKPRRLPNVAVTKRGCLLTAKHLVFDEATGKSTPFLWMRFPLIDGMDEQPIASTLFGSQGRIYGEPVRMAET